jgi:hypothetical protein
LIEYSQLVRKFGELTYPIQDEREQQIKKLKDEVMHLKKQLNFFKYTSISNKNRLLISHNIPFNIMALYEHLYINLNINT